MTATIEFRTRAESILFMRRFGFVNIAAALEEAERQEAEAKAAFAAAHTEATETNDGGAI